MLLSSALLLVITVAAPATAVGQRSIPPGTALAWVNDLRPAAEAYRAGDLVSALRILDERKPSELQALAKLLVTHVERPYKAPALADDRGRPVLPWTRGLLHALAALEMEAARRVYIDRSAATSPEDVQAYVRAAEPLFAYLAASGTAQQAAARWKLVVGATALADGQLWWASRLFDVACAEHPDYAALLVACGSASEAIAMLPAHVLLAEGRSGPDTEPSGFTPGSQRDARRARSLRLDLAQRWLERALAVAPGDSEAALRLAHVYSLRGADAQAMRLLERLLQQPALDARTAYLARLFAGRLYHRRQENQRAAEVLREATEVLPSAQTAFTGLIQVLLADGEVRGAASIVKGMLRPPADTKDPWWGYTYGQFWTVEPLLAALRDEARQ